MQEIQRQALPGTCLLYTSQSQYGNLSPDQAGENHHKCNYRKQDTTKQKDAEQPLLMPVKPFPNGFSYPPSTRFRRRQAHICIQLLKTLITLLGNLFLKQAISHRRPPSCFLQKISDNQCALCSAFSLCTVFIQSLQIQAVSQIHTPTPVSYTHLLRFY